MKSLSGRRWLKIGKQDEEAEMSLTTFLIPPSCSPLEEFFYGLKLKDSKRINRNLEFAKGENESGVNEILLVVFHWKTEINTGINKAFWFSKYEHAALFVNASHRFETRHSSYTHFKEPDMTHLLSLGYILLPTTAGVDLSPRQAP